VDRSAGAAIPSDDIARNRGLAKDLEATVAGAKALR